ncbi:phosphoribosyltransferase family protein [Actinoplanes sp. NPDC049316]|uniref:phosphoribosyltransferase n=1 Tax=Actinoplanes sp. NPDC049316 TaxID=3154727 RepID=UPI003426896A
MAADAPPILLAWEELVVGINATAVNVRSDGLPDLVIGILRGGMVPATVFAHALAVRTVRAVEVVHTVSDDMNAAKTPAPQVSNAASLGELSGRDVLIVDDIAGTGDTMAYTAQLVAAAGATRVRTAVCIVNAANWRRAQPPEQALSYIGATVEGWVIFPWENR